jgi:putative spermidine/putrescine transport system ATP-binding protein
MIAGLLDPSEGDIQIKGRRINDVPIHKRNLGLVFQNYALFPAQDDCRERRLRPEVSRRRQGGADERVKKALDLVQLPDVGDRYPKQLSGGQQQRIALARAIVIEPDVLLLDEPLSALDANLREDMRVELKRIQHQIGITTVFVTHDQAEALAMSDRIVVMSNGRVEQVGAPEDVYNDAGDGIRGTLSRRLQHPALDLHGCDRDDGRWRIPPSASWFCRASARRMSPGRARSSWRCVPKTVNRGSWSSGCHRRGCGQRAGRVETVDYQGLAARYFVRVGDEQLQAINMIDGSPFAEGAAVSMCGSGRATCTILPEAAMMSEREKSHLFYQSRRGGRCSTGRAASTCGTSTASAISTARPARWSATSAIPTSACWRRCGGRWKSRPSATGCISKPSLRKISPRLTAQRAPEGLRRYSSSPAALRRWKAPSSWPGNTRSPSAGAALQGHLAPAELSRLHARGAGAHRLCAADRAFRADDAADAEDPGAARLSRRLDPDDPATGHHYADMLEAKHPRGGAGNGARLHRGADRRRVHRRAGAAAGYMQRVREICDRYGVLLIHDEVMCGGGRTGRSLPPSTGRRAGHSRHVEGVCGRLCAARRHGRA